MPASPDTEFWSRLRSLCLEHARDRLTDYNDEQIEPVLRGLETDLKIVFEQFAESIRRRRRETPLTAVIARRQLTEACRALLLDPPTRMEKVGSSFFDKARRQFRTLARQYHPDTSAGGESMRPQFEAVMQAWNVLQQFQRQLQSTSA